MRRMNSADPLALVMALGDVNRVRETPVEEIPALLGQLERLKAMLWHRLVVAPPTPTRSPTLEQMEDLRHVTPQAAGELLSLKPAYVHELCRTGRLPATKSGKYWMIPVAGLRTWLASEKSDVDVGIAARLESLNPRSDSGSRGGSHGRPKPAARA